MDGPWEGNPDVVPALTALDSLVVVVVVLVV